MSLRRHEVPEAISLHNGNSLGLLRRARNDRKTTIYFVIMYIIIMNMFKLYKNIKISTSNLKFKRPQISLVCPNLKLFLFCVLCSVFCILYSGCGSQQNKPAENPLKKQSPSTKSNSNNPLEQYSDEMLKTLDKAKEVDLTVSLSQIRVAMETYRMENESYPTTLSNNLQELNGYLDAPKILSKFPNQQITSYKGSANNYNYELVVETQKTIYTLTPYGINKKDK